MATTVSATDSAETTEATFCPSERVAVVSNLLWENGQPAEYQSNGSGSVADDDRTHLSDFSEVERIWSNGCSSSTDDDSIDNIFRSISPMENFDSTDDIGECLARISQRNQPPSPIRHETNLQQNKKYDYNDDDRDLLATYLDKMETNFGYLYPSDTDSTMLSSSTTRADTFDTMLNWLESQDSTIDESGSGAKHEFVDAILNKLEMNFSRLSCGSSKTFDYENSFDEDADKIPTNTIVGTAFRQMSERLLWHMGVNVQSQQPDSASREDEVTLISEWEYNDNSDIHETFDDDIGEVDSEAYSSINERDDVKDRGYTPTGHWKQLKLQLKNLTMSVVTGTTKST
mmetsp:Transcript_62504/g.74009  ORF Transcript_62504/g.74009 Transcript_62504/m.74009 type:complete len:344 (-) Transcript_62504:83-1114(-)